MRFNDLDYKDQEVVRQMVLARLHRPDFYQIVTLPPILQGFVDLALSELIIKEGWILPPILKTSQ